MLHAAHASCYLWSRIGTERNMALADLLLGQVDALLGRAQAATGTPRRHSHFASRPSEAWELAFAYAVQASAAAVAGNSDLHRDSYAKERDRRCADRSRKQEGLRRHVQDHSEARRSIAERELRSALLQSGSPMDDTVREGGSAPGNGHDTETPIPP